jgi:biotin-(acetyl-CoA carboxylase) ligase
MDAETLTHALAPLPVGPVRYYAQIGSTNTEAARWAEAGAPDLALVVADEQTAGRGRFKRRWFTPPDSALAFSLVLRRRTRVDAYASHMALPRKQSISDEGRKRDGGERIFTRLTALGALAVREALEARWETASRSSG